MLSKKGVMGAHIAARELVARHGTEALAVARRALAALPPADEAGRERWQLILSTVERLLGPAAPGKAGQRRR